MLLEEFLIPMGLTQRELADAIKVPYQRVNEIVNKRRGITAATGNASLDINVKHLCHLILCD